MKFKRNEALNRLYREMTKEINQRGELSDRTFKLAVNVMTEEGVNAELIRKLFNAEFALDFVGEVIDTDSVSDEHNNVWCAITGEMFE